MKWRAAPSRAKERANISFFIFIMFFAVFGVIILTELLPLERPNEPTRSRNDHLQVRNPVLISFIRFGLYSTMTLKFDRSISNIDWRLVIDVIG